MADTKPVIEIEYCTSCNYLPRTLWVAAELLPDLQYEIDAFRFTPGTRGVFEVRVSGQSVFSKNALGRFPEPDELKQLIFDQLEAKR
jgi:selenoprotein W-related protein